MKKPAVALSCFLLIANSSAESVPTVEQITKKIAQSVTAYANAISCGDVEISPKDIAALVPYAGTGDRDSFKYAVLWEGDIGCIGGSGTESTNISIVTVGAGDSFVVDPLQSSPVIDLISTTAGGLPKLIGNTKDTIVLDGLEYDPSGKDDNCCPSIPVRITVRVDEKGNWNVIDKKIRKAKK